MVVGVQGEEPEASEKGFTVFPGPSVKYTHPDGISTE